jgi:Nickel responsive protein SCO4226-like
MNTYVIFRRAGWRSAEELQAAAPHSKQVGEDMSDDIRWIRSYVVSEPAGAVGTVCVYQASSPEAIREHAAAANVPVDEIVEVLDTVVLRPDPAPVTS